MAIDPTGSYYNQISTSGNKSLATTKDKTSMGKDDFLKLLVTQLKNQDPLNPMQGADFSAQLAQFSSLEQLTNVNTTLSGIQSSLSANKQDNLIEYIGKTVKTNNSNLSIFNGKVGSSVYSLDDTADVKISILNSAGVEVRNIKGGFKDSGEYTIDWDGCDNNGKKLNDGAYSAKITAKDKNGKDVSAGVYSSGEVTGVTYQDGTAYLMVGGNNILPDNIVKITAKNS